MKKRKKRKKYNSFKMWGSWVGALIPLLFTLYWIFFQCIPKIGDFGIQGCVLVTSLLGIVIIIIGFLSGWGIHTLIRKFK